MTLYNRAAQVCVLVLTPFLNGFYSPAEAQQRPWAEAKSLTQKVVASRQMA